MACSTRSSAGGPLNRCCSSNRLPHRVGRGLRFGAARLEPARQRGKATISALTQAQTDASYTLHQFSFNRKRPYCALIQYTSAHRLVFACGCDMGVVRQNICAAVIDLHSDELV